MTEIFRIEKWNTDIENSVDKLKNRMAETKIIKEWEINNINYPALIINKNRLNKKKVNVDLGTYGAKDVTFVSL